MRLEVGWTISSSSKILHCLKYAIWLVEIMKWYMQRQNSYKVHMNTISNGELSDPLCDSVKRGLTLVRLDNKRLSNAYWLCHSPMMQWFVYLWLCLLGSISWYTLPKSTLLLYFWILIKKFINLHSTSFFLTFVQCLRIFNI